MILQIFCRLNNYKINNSQGGDGVEDQDIISLFIKRSENAIVELSKKYEKLCCYIALNVLNNQEDAKECVNDAYLKVWNSIPPQHPSSLIAYVVKITRYTSIDRLKYNKRKKRNQEMDLLLSELDECISSKQDVFETIYEGEVIRAINKFLRLLDDEAQILFVRRYTQMESIESLAKQFHLSESNVSTKLCRLRKRLKKYLEKEGVYL